MSSSKNKPGNNVGRKCKRSMKDTKAVFNKGRPRKSVADISMRSLQRRAHEIAKRANFNVKLLEMSLTIGKKHKEGSISNQLQELTKEETLALYLELYMTREKWRKLLKVQKRKQWEVFSSCHVIAQAKTECLLPKFVTATESEVKVPFQDSLDKTSVRLFHALKGKFSAVERNFVLSVAYGFDGSSGHKNPHQFYENEENFTDEMLQTMFATTYTIISLKYIDTGTEWMNPSIQSTRFCRPLRLALEKEVCGTGGTILEEKNRLYVEVDNFVPFQTSVDGKNVVITYDADLTNIDGKDLSAILENSSTLRCPLCEFTMHQYAHDVDVKYHLDSKKYAHGLGLLHCYIRTLDFLLHLSYKLPFKSWSIAKQYNNELQKRQEFISKKLFNEFHVHVDKVLQGKGTSNTGNVAKKLLSKPTLLAQTLEFDEGFVENISTILMVFSSKHEIDFDKFEPFCESTNALFYRTYEWAKMRPTVHKYLKHGVAISKSFKYPQAYFAEDAGEHMHKLYRSFRLDKTVVKTDW